MSARISFALALAVLSALVVGCGSSSDDDGAATVVIDCLGAQHPEPQEVESCGADQGIVVRKIEWTAWGQDPAYGQGIAIANTCLPYCAAGNYKQTPVVLVASNPQPCGGKDFYKRMQYADLGHLLPGSGRMIPSRNSDCTKP